MDLQCTLMILKKLKVSANPKLFDSAFTMMLHSNFNFSSGKNITKIVVRQQNKTKTYIGTNQTDDTVHCSHQYRTYTSLSTNLSVLCFFHCYVILFLHPFWTYCKVYVGILKYQPGLQHYKSNFCFREASTFFWTLIFVKNKFNHVTTT